MKKIKIFLLILLIFTCGLMTERFQLDNKITNYFKSIYDRTSRYVYSFSSNEKIEISISPKEYKKLSSSRNKALKAGLLHDDMQRWAEAKLIFNDIKRDIKIRIKGVFPDHWTDNKRWSFKVRVKNNSKNLNDFTRFNLQTPETSSFMYEWLLMKSLEKEKLISLKTKYYELVLNGESIGAYMFQGGLSDEVLKLNNREIGPIVGFNKELFLKEYSNSRKLKEFGLVGSLNSTEDSFWRSKIEPVQFSNLNKDINQEKYLNKAIYLLESFRNGTKKPSEVFEINKLAKIMSIRALLGSSEFDYRDTKFYFNPIIQLLEPITKESHVDLNLNFKDHYFSWWIDSTNIKPHRPGNKNFFLDILYKDKTFHELYLKELSYMTKDNFFKNLINENKSEFERYLKIQKKNYPSQKVFSLEQLEINRLRVKEFLNPVQGVNVYFSNYNQNILQLVISNLQRLPVEILGLKLNSGEEILLKKPFYINGKKPHKPTKNVIVKFDCLFKEECKKISINNQKVLFRILGQKKPKKAEISMHYFKSE